ncbi:MAG: small multi-drug export protein [Methanobacterium sp.]|uniref:small multi-drug export protein n=1 Tax=Methanobacterium sp. TaxID=2164 RepID=UPI003C714741
MDIITSIIAVFGASIIELWLGIPLGFFLKLNPLLIVILSSAGSILSAYLVIILGEGIRKRFIKWRYGEQSIKKGRLYYIWDKYGIIGLGLLSPLLFGAPLGAALGIGLGAPRYRLLFWMSIGIVIWSIFLTALGFFGLMSFQSILK